MSEESAFDLVLVDAPCSGTGTLGRNPEIRHRLRLEDLPRQAERQRAILSAALGAVHPGGRVVYSTCSLEPEENEEVVGAVLDASANARLIPLGDCIGALAVHQILSKSGAELLRGAMTTQGLLRLLPGPTQNDGFFAALIERRA